MPFSPDMEGLSQVIELILSTNEQVSRGVQTANVSPEAVSSAKPHPLAQGSNREYEDHMKQLQFGEWPHPSLQMYCCL